MPRHRGPATAPTGGPAAGGRVVRRVVAAGAAIRALVRRWRGEAASRCPCPICTGLEQAARTRAGMPVSHPEQLTASLPRDRELWLAEQRAVLWPAGEYLTIIDDTGPAGGP